MNEVSHAQLLEQRGCRGGVVGHDRKGGAMPVNIFEKLSGAGCQMDQWEPLIRVNARVALEQAVAFVDAEVTDAEMADNLRQTRKLGEGEEDRVVGEFGDLVRREDLGDGPTDGSSRRVLAGEQRVQVHEKHAWWRSYFRRCRF